MSYPGDYTRDGADRLLAHTRTLPPEERWRRVRDEATSAMAWCAGAQVPPYALPIPNRVWVVQMMIAELGATTPRPSGATNLAQQAFGVNDAKPRTRDEVRADVREALRVIEEATGRKALVSADLAELLAEDAEQTKPSEVIGGPARTGQD